MNKNVYSVSQVNTYIERMFSDDFMLGNLSLSGEVSNCKYNHTGHIYFTLKDEKSAISCVMFAGKRPRGLKFQRRLWSDSPHPLWHEGPVSWKTIFPWTRVGGWFRDDSSTLQLLCVLLLLLLHRSHLRSSGIRS